MRRRAIPLWPARKSQRDGRNATRYKAVWPSGWFFEGGAPFFVKIISKRFQKRLPIFIPQVASPSFGSATAAFRAPSRILAGWLHHITATRREGIRSTLRCTSGLRRLNSSRAARDLTGTRDHGGAPACLSRFKGKLPAMEESRFKVDALIEWS
jgi:hypothetical protein